MNAYSYTRLVVREYVYVCVSLSLSVSLCVRSSIALITTIVYYALLGRGMRGYWQQLPRATWSWVV